MANDPTKTPPKLDPAQKWLLTLSWVDKLIARCFPRFFKSYAPEEIQQQWAEYCARSQAKSQAQKHRDGS
jgi:hypothetical protein